MPTPHPGEIIIGVDTHKHVHAAVAITSLGARVSTIAVPGLSQTRR